MATKVKSSTRVHDLRIKLRGLRAAMELVESAVEARLDQHIEDLTEFAGATHPAIIRGTQEVSAN